MSVGVDTSQLRETLGRFARFNWVGGVVIGLLLLFQLGAILLTPYLSQWGFPVEQTTDVRFGAGFIAYIVAASLLLIGGYWVYRRYLAGFSLPRFILYGVLALEGVAIVWLSVSSGRYELLALTAAAIVGLYAAREAYRWLDGSGLLWVVHNAAAIGGGVFITALMARAVSPGVVIVIAVGLLVWDYVAVYLTSIMDRIVNISSAANLPNYIIIPNGWRVDMAGVRDVLDPEGDADGTPEDVAAVIGVGDFAIPGLLAVSAAIAFGAWNVTPVIGPIVGTVAAVPVLMSVMAETEGGVPGLPWLNYGAISGFLIGGVFV